METGAVKFSVLTSLLSASTGRLSSAELTKCAAVVEDKLVESSSMASFMLVRVPLIVVVVGTVVEALAEVVVVCLLVCLLEVVVVVILDVAPIVVKAPLFCLATILEVNVKLVDVVMVVLCVIVIVVVNVLVPTIVAKARALSSGERQCSTTASHQVEAILAMPFIFG